MASTINATTSGVVTTGDSVATLSLQTSGTTAVAIDSAQIVSLSKSLALLGSTSGSVALAAPATAGTQSYTLPTAQPTADGLALTSTKVGAMSWASPTATAAGSDTQVQYNNGGTAFGAASTFTFNNSTGVVSATGFSGAVNGTVGATTPAAGTFTTATARAAATQDSVVLQGRAGGTSSYAATITPTTLTASRTVTLPNADINFATGLPVANGGTGLTSGTSGGVPYFSNTSAISSSAALTQYGVVYGGGAGAAPVATAVGTTGQFLGANTGGAPTWQTPSGGGSPAGADTQIQYNSGGSSFGASANLTFSSNALTVNSIKIWRGNGNEGSSLAIGSGTLPAVTSGAENTFIGIRSGELITTGSFNCGIGPIALFKCTTGNYNIAYGEAGLAAVTTGDKNTSVGVNAGGIVTTGSDNIAIGFGTNFSSTAASNQIVFGSSLTAKGDNTAFIGGTSGAYNGANSSTWSITSDERIKKNIVPVSDSLAKINALRPVEFDYKENDRHEAGFIAQEFKQVFPDQVIFHDPNQIEAEWVGEDKVMGIQQNLVPFLVKAVQELSAANEALAVRIAALEAK